jgi:class 3 adenylate cyclase
MKIKNFSGRFCRKCLQQSLPVDMMIRIARLVSPKYDMYKRSGLTEGMPISNQDAAHRITLDMIESGCFVDFVEALVLVDAKGYMGRSYAIRGIDDVVNDLIQGGYSFDKATGQFFENQNERISQNWGRLRNGDERQMTVLRLDVAGNSVLVKQNSSAAVEKAYGDLRAVVSRAVTKRLGRLWSWEGDGALAAFLFGQKEKAAVFCGMEILHELYFYNRLKNPLNKPVRLRLAAHIGMVHYYNDPVERLKSDTIKQAAALESSVPPDSLGISRNFFISMDQAILNLFTPERASSSGKYRLYNAAQEQL